MCVDPVSAGLAIGTFALSAASSMAEQGAKETKYAAETTRYNQNYQNSLAAGRDADRQLTIRQVQEQEAFGQKDHAALLHGAEKAAEVSVSAAGANVAGLSVGNLIADVQRKTDTNRTNLFKNWEMTAQQIQTEKDGAVNKTQSRINSVAKPIAPDDTGMWLGIAGAGLKAAGGLYGSASFAGMGGGGSAGTYDLGGSSDDWT